MVIIKLIQFCFVDPVKTAAEAMLWWDTDSYVVAEMCIVCMKREEGNRFVHCAVEI